DRALAETNIVILVRQKIAGVLADMTSYARFLIGWSDEGDAGPLWSAPPSTSATGSTRASRRRLSTSCSQQASFRPIRRLTATLPPASTPPGARSRRSSIATAPRTRRNCTRATRRGLARRNERRSTRRCADVRRLRSAREFRPSVSLDRRRAEAPVESRDLHAATHGPINVR